LPTIRCIKTSPVKTQISNATVDVWFCRIDEIRDEYRRLLGFLSPDEKERADRFHFEKHHRQFVSGRGVLRTILACYLDNTPEQVRFAYTKYGKPFLEGPPGSPEITFNMSHSEDLCLYAISRDRDVGIDVEHIRSDVDIEAVSASVFSQRELDEFSRVEPSLRPNAFFDLWTRKEACVKAVGGGLSIPLNSVEVAGVVEVHGRSWSIAGLVPSEGYIGAVAVEGGDISVNVSRWLLP
jgi:4'-phosphopantetheinyl transferase